MTFDPDGLGMFNILTSEATRSRKQNPDQLKCHRSWLRVVKRSDEGKFLLSHDEKRKEEEPNGTRDEITGGTVATGRRKEV